MTGISPQTPDAGALLEHAGFVRAMARGVLGADALVDDAVQETWLAAFRGGPREPGRLRSWLGSVARRRALDLRRREATRARHEPLTSARAAPPTPDDLASRAELGQRLVAALLALDDVHRTALLQRYYEGLSPDDIARRVGAPLETVRTRLKRGLEKLRRALDEDDDRRRRAWALVIVPWAAPELADAEGGPPPAVPTFVSAVATVAGLAAFFACAYLLLPELGPIPPNAAAGGGAVQGTGGAGAETAAKDARGPGRSGRAAPRGASEDSAAAGTGGAPAPAAGSADGLTVSGAVRDPDGRPVPFIALRWVLKKTGEPNPSPAADVFADAAGRYEIKGLAPGAIEVFLLSERGFGPSVDFDTRLEASLVHDFALNGRLRMQGRVEAPGAEGAELWLDFHQEYAGGLSTATWDIRHLRLPADGAFDVNALRPGAYVLHVKAPGFEAYEEEIRLVEDRRDLVIRPRRAVTLTGRIVRDGGLAAGNTWFWIAPEDGRHSQEMLRCEDDASFSVPSLPAGRYRVFVRHTVETTSQAVHTERTVTIDVTDPPAPVEIRLAPDVEIGLRLTPPDGLGNLTGRVTVEGSPAETPHHVDFVIYHHADGFTVAPRHGSLIFPPPRVNTDDGALRIDGMPPGRYVLHVETLGCETLDLPVDASVAKTLDVKLVRRPGRLVTAAIEAKYFRVEARRSGTAAWTTVVWMDDRVRLSHRATPGETRGHLAPGRWEFLAVGDSFAETPLGPIDVDDLPEPLALKFALRPGASISGAVTAGADVPVNGARLHVFRVEDGRAERLEEKETSVEEGIYAVRGLAPGRYRIAASKDGEPVLAEVDVDAADVVQHLTLSK